VEAASARASFIDRRRWSIHAIWRRIILRAAQRPALDVDRTRASAARQRAVRVGAVKGCSGNREASAGGPQQ
jgi:hypothetical protein